MIVTPIEVEIKMYGVFYPGHLGNVSELKDQLKYGFSATDKEGNRIDPASLRRKIDGSYVVLTEN